MKKRLTIGLMIILALFVSVGASAQTQDKDKKDKDKKETKDAKDTPKAHLDFDPVTVTVEAPQRESTPRNNDGPPDREPNERRTQPSAPTTPSVISNLPKPPPIRYVELVTAKFTSQPTARIGANWV